MPYVPPGVPASTFSPGIHEVVLVEFKLITSAGTLGKLGARVAYKAVCKSLETAVEIDLLIKYNGSKGDYYSGLNIDLLHLVAGLEAPTSETPLDITALVTHLSGVPFLLEVNDRGYANSIILPEASTGTEEAF